MSDRNDLLGQARVVREVEPRLDGGRSALLFGPEDIGKTAVIEVARRPGIVVVDPLQYASPQRASKLRRALDRGVLHLAAARVPSGRELGAVGRILWRFSTVRVRELPDPIRCRIVARALPVSHCTARREWIREVAALAKGRPGFATNVARVASEWARTHGDVPTPVFAFAAAREDEAIRSLRGGGVNLRRVRTAAGAQ
jgi:hypothetical protein